MEEILDSKLWYSVEDALDVVDNLYCNPNLSNLIFMHDQERAKFLQKPRNLNVYLNNLLIVAFMYVYGKYLDWRKNKFNDLQDKPELKNSSNFMRIITSFEKLYYEFNLSYEFIENILNDIQILMGSDVEANKLLKELGIYGDFEPSDYFSAIMRATKLGRMSIRNQNINIGYLRFLLVKFLEMMPFLLKIDINYVSLNLDLIKVNMIQDEKQCEFEKLILKQVGFSKNNYEVSFSVLHSKETEQYYYLESVIQREVRMLDNNKEKYVILKYAKLGAYNDENQEQVGSYQYILVRNEDSNIEEDIENLYIYEDKKGIDSFRHMLFYSISNIDDDNGTLKDFNAINFRYIRVLALAISDTLDDSGRKYLYEKYKDRREYKDMFVSPKSGEVSEDNLLKHYDEEKGYGWDIVIATLLIEESATKLLQELFSFREDYYKKVVNNLKYRFRGEEFNVDEIIESARQKTREEINNIKYRIYGSKESKYLREERVGIYKQVSTKIQAQGIVKKLSDLTYSNENSEIRTKFPLSISSRIKIIDEIQKSLDDDNESIDWNDTLKGLKILVCQTLKTLYCFYYGLFEYAKVKIEFEKESVNNVLSPDDIRISQKNANNLFDKAMKTKLEEMKSIDKCDVHSTMLKIKELCKICVSANKFNTLLKRMLGREFLLNYGNISCLENCFDDIDEPSNQHNKSLLKKLIGQIKDVFLYLKDGKIGSGTYDGVIFPYVAFLDYTSTTRDGYEVNHFSIVSDDKEKDIRVISEYKYNLNQSYYCIPNRYRSNNELNLWIEPILINYKHVIKDMEEEQKNE